MYRILASIWHANARNDQMRVAEIVLRAVTKLERERSALRHARPTRRKGRTR
jgi:hypothetical protein